MFYSLYELLRLSIRCLAANVLRSLLTLLGIIIGVASVIFMMSVTAGASREILQEMEQLGLENIIINSLEPAGDEATTGQPNRVKFYGLTNQDIEQIRATCDDVEFVSLAHEVRQEMWHGGQKIDARVLGVDARYFRTLRLTTVSGRLICDIDNDSRSRVCNVDEQLLDRYAIVQDPDLVKLDIDGVVYDIVGVIEQPRFTTHNRKIIATGSKYLTVYLPARTALQHYGTMTLFLPENQGIEIEIDQAIVRVKTAGSVLTAARAIDRILRANHPRHDYDLIVPLKLLQQREKTQQVFGITMILIAGISLVVGGIGIINIMLATVTERTREIGIRRACGAKRSHIAYQFLIETTTLSLLGGIIGACVGIGGVHVVAPRIGWAAIVTPESLMLALGISCVVGVLFGTYPAIKASRMDPIEALRFE
ncbi:MAG: ABC transporter permease [Planctomycetota bacterium]